METERLLAQNFAEDHPGDAALLLERLPPPETSAYLDQLPARQAAAILQRLVPPYAAECLNSLTPHRFALAIEALPLDTTASLLRRLEPPAQERLLRQANPDTSTLLQRLLQFPDASAGALMDPRVPAFPEDITATEALSRVRRAPRHALYYLYVVDRAQQLTGVLNLRELMLASPKALLRAFMQRQVVTITPLADRRAIIEHFGWRNVHALPVVDERGVLLGVLRYETLRQLEGKSAADAPAADALSTVLTLGELCWVGLAGVLTDLSTSIGAMATAPETVKEPGDGP